MNPNHVQRFTLVQRLVHWTVGLSFTLLLLTGFAFSYPSLFWLTVLVGGGPSSRVLHPWIGFVFTASLGWMFALWVKDMFVTGADKHWLRSIQHYALHTRDKIPPVGKYNGGQKIFFWVQSVLGVVLVITGLPLWVPDGILGFGPLSSLLLTTMRAAHYLCALGGSLLLIVHVYLGLMAFPGTARGMIDGKVSQQWAELHHPLWKRK